MEERENKAALRIIRAGVLTTWVVAGVSLVYLLATWSAGHRPLLLATAAVATLDGAVIFCQRHRIAASRRHEALLAAWNAAHIGCAVLMCQLDGGLASPFVSIFFISVAFAASSLPLRLVVSLAALDVVAVLVLAVLRYAQDAVWDPVSVVWAGTLVVIAGVCTTIAHDRTERIAALQAAREDVPRRLARVVEYRDSDTGGHVERMADYAALIAQALGLAAEDCRQLKLASPMHDIGKVAVPDAILLKPGKLTPEERAIMETHTVVGRAMLADSGSELLDLAAQIALTHHERHDGGGYPHGVRGEDIPLVGRIVAVADVFDAVTSKRVYKDAVDVGTAVRIITEGRGTQFDPAVVDAFLGALAEIKAVRARHTVGQDEMPAPALLAA